MTAITTAGSGTWSSTTPDNPWPSGTVPGEGDTVTIANTHTVTIDQNVTVGNDSTTAAITINSGGTLKAVYNAAAAYTLTLKGDMTVNGTLEIGTVANPIPIGKEFTIITNYSASLSDGKFGIKIGEGAAATVTLQGATKTYYKALLAADAADTATSITTDVSTGWKDNDVLALAPTSRTYSEYETLTMNGDASGTTINFDSPAGLAYDHSGTSPTQAEVCNLTRTVKIKSYNSANPGYITVKNAGTTIDIDWVEFNGLGCSPEGKQGHIVFLTNSLNTAAAIRYCSFYGGDYYGLYNYRDNNKLDIQDCVFHMIVSLAVYIASSLTGSTLTNLYIIGTTSGYGFYLNDDFIESTASYITVAGSVSNGIVINNATPGSTFAYLTAHSCGGRGVNIGSYTADMSIITTWRNAGYGVYSGADTTITTLTSFGNSTNIYCAAGDTKIYGATVNSDASYTTARGIYLVHGARATVENGTFGSTTSHTTADVCLQGVGELTLIKCTLASSTEVYNHYEFYRNSFVRSHDHDATEGTHKTWKRQGIIEADATVYKTAAPSEKITPYYAAEKLESHSRYLTCADGATKTVKVWVRKAAAYDGDEPRLILKRNYAAGVTSDAVLDTMTAAVETWEQLSGVVTAPSEDTVYEVVVDCADGTAAGHYINVDDWTVE